MAVVTIISAGMMDSALALPLTVRHYIFLQSVFLL